MKRQPISTRRELQGYLHDLAWSRYRLRYEPDAELTALGDESLTPAQVRATIAEIENQLRWQYLQTRGFGAGEILR